MKTTIVVAIILASIAINFILQLSGEVDVAYNKYNKVVQDSAQNYSGWAHLTHNYETLVDHYVQTLALSDSICYESKTEDCKKMNKIVGYYWGFTSNWVFQDTSWYLKENYSK